MKAEVEMKVEMEFPLLSSDVLTCVLFLFFFFWHFVSVRTSGPL